MKKLLILIVTVMSLMLSACVGPEIDNSDGSDQTPGDNTTHEHSFVDGKCECGTTDPDYEPPHEHRFVDGVCECGTTDPDYEPPHEHRFVDGVCECGATSSADPSGCAEHKDGNNDGKCDECKISVIVIIDFYALNDLHGKLDDTDEFVGVDELTTYLKNASLTDDHTVLLSSGDMWQGSSESNLTRGQIITEWMNELDFVSMTIGNHEYDWGSEYIKINAELAEFPILAINIKDKSTGAQVDYAQSSVLVERGGAKIGIIGAIGDCKSSISSGYVSDVDFLVGSELTSLVKAEADRLRSLGADFIVYSLHDGYGRSSSSVQNMSSSAMSSYYNTILSNGYVDLVFEGHSHQSYVHKDTYGVYHLQNGGDDNGISHVEISLNYVNDSYTVNTAEIVKNSTYKNLPDDPSVDALLDKYADVLSIANRELGFNSTIRDGDELRQIIADLYLQAGLEKWGANYDIVLGGGYLSVRSPYDLAAGNIKYGDLMSIFPFDNEIVLCSVSGSKLLSQFINSSNSNYFISLSDYGKSISSSIVSSGTYYVIVDTYTADYAPNGLTTIASLGEGIFARDLLADYIEEGHFGNYTLSSIPEIYSEAEKLGYGVASSVKYYVKGVIAQEPEATYGNTTIVDEDGNSLYVYGIKSSSGGLFNTIANKPKVGDTVILSGVILNYQYSDGSSIIELKNAQIVTLNAK